MKVLVCGGRDYEDDYRLWSVLDGLDSVHELKCVIHGGAKGADELAGLWAREKGIQDVVCNANWTKYGKRAGYVRNAAMLDLKPDLVVAFPGGNGTKMMVKIAKEAGVEVVVVS